IDQHSNRSSQLQIPAQIWKVSKFISRNSQKNHFFCHLDNNAQLVRSLAWLPHGFHLLFGLGIPAHSRSCVYFPKKPAQRCLPRSTRQEGYTGTLTGWTQAAASAGSGVASANPSLAAFFRKTLTSRSRCFCS